MVEILIAVVALASVPTIVTLIYVKSNGVDYNTSDRMTFVSCSWAIILWIYYCVKESQIEGAFDSIWTIIIFILLLAFAGLIGGLIGAIVPIIIIKNAENKKRMEEQQEEILQLRTQVSQATACLEENITDIQDNDIGEDPWEYKILETKKVKVLDDIVLDIPKEWPDSEYIDYVSSELEDVWIRIVSIEDCDSYENMIESTVDELGLEGLAYKEVHKNLDYCQFDKYISKAGDVVVTFGVFNNGKAYRICIGTDDVRFCKSSAEALFNTLQFL